MEGEELEESHLEVKFTELSLFPLKVSRQVKLELQDSEYFHVVGPKDAGSKVVPGISATFTVSFTPKENKVLRQRWVPCWSIL